jgi:hypothetical protein
MSDVVFPAPPTGAAQIVHLASGEDVVGVVTHDEARSGYVIRDPVTPQVEVDPKKGTMRLGRSFPTDGRGISAIPFEDRPSQET